MELKFDNTLSTKLFANSIEGKKILNDTCTGTETQLYKVGQKVDGNGHGFKSGVITHVFCENGYYRYVIEFMYNGNHYSRKVLRTCDITLI